MVGYKLSKNDLVAPFFVIFRSVREKLLVTVFFDHPVAHSPEIKRLQTNIDLNTDTKTDEDTDTKKGQIQGD